MTRLALIVLLVFGGCVSAPPVSPAVARDARSLRPADGKARIYVSRPNAYGAALVMQVFIDGVMIGTLPAQASIFADVEPGKRTVSTMIGRSATTSVDLAAGEVAFIRWTNSGKLERSTPETGKVNVVTNSIVAPDGYNPEDER